MNVFRGGTLKTSFATKSTKGTKVFSTSVPSVSLVAYLALWCHAEDAPQPVVELEGRLRAEQVITRHATRSSSAVLRNSIHVIRRTVTLLGSLPLGERIVADLGRVVDVWLLL